MKTATSRRSKFPIRLATDLALPVDFVTETISLLAIKGAGKTYAFLKLAEQIIKAGQPVVIVDHVGVCWGLRSSADGTKAGLPVYVLGGAHGDAPLEPYSGKVVGDWIVRTRVPVVLDLSAFNTKADELRFVADLADTIYRRNRAPLMVMIDEADEFAPQKPRDVATKSLHAIEMLVRRGRARGIGILMATQRPAVLNKDVLTQSGTLMFGRVVSPHDRAAVKLWLAGQSSAHDVDRIVNALPSMARGTFQLWSPAAGIFQEIEIAARETFDSSATPKAGQRRREPKTLRPMDLDVLGDEMRKAREEREANDPARLKAELERLRRAIGEADTRHHQLRVSYAETVRKRQTIKRVPIMTKAERAVLQKVSALATAQAALLQKLVSGNDRNSKAIETTITRMLARVDALSNTTNDATTATAQDKGHDTIPTRTGARAVDTGGQAASTRQPARRASHEDRTHASRSPDAGALAPGDHSLNDIKRKILTLAIQHDGVSRAQLGVYLTARAKGSTMREYIRQLKAAGLAEVGSAPGKGDGILWATAEGKAAIGEVEHIPTDRASLIGYWRERLGDGAKREVFDMVAATGTATKPEIANALGTKASGSTLREYLRQLKALGVLMVSGDTVQLSGVFDGR